MKQTRTRPLLFVTGLLGALGGCMGPSSYDVDVPEPEVPVQDPAPATPGSLTVKPGDTLYSIAFSVGSDWHTLAAANGIAAPYTIYPGQKLRLPNAAVMTAAEPEQSIAEPSLQVSATPVAIPAQAAPARADPPPMPLPEPVAVRPPAPAPAPSSSASTPAVAMQVPPAVASTVQRTGRQGAWRWPASGRLVRGFSTAAPPHKGVDIAGNEGDPVYAANGGTVVYAGSGVRGYGNLLIVKHDSQYLSAYAHNSRLLVKEGEVVDGGQKIAEIGNSGTDRVKLHFELRRKGDPVDPLKLLPRR